MNDELIWVATKLQSKSKSISTIKAAAVLLIITITLAINMPTQWKFNIRIHYFLYETFYNIYWNKKDSD